MTCTAISAVVPRKRTTLAGRVTSVTAYVQPWVRVDVELGDGTRTITLRFMGRSVIPGMVLGRLVAAEGTPAIIGESLVILNPLYSFLADETQRK